MNNLSLIRSRFGCGVTAGSSAYALLKGQLAWFNSNGWDVTLVSNPDELAKESVRREWVSFFGIKMEREVTVFKNSRFPFQRAKFLIRLRPDVISAGNPKVALL